MLDRGAQRARLWVAGLAAGGVVVSHWLAYLLAVPDAHSRADILAATGHRYWIWVVAVAFGAFVAALSCYTMGVLRAGSPGRGSYDAGGVTVRLIALHVPGLLLLESAERVLSHGHVHVLSLLSEPAVVMGLVVQMLVALAGGMLVRLWARAVVLLRSSREPHVRRSGSCRVRLYGVVLPPRRPLLGAATLRAPPHSAPF